MLLILFNFVDLVLVKNTSTLRIIDLKGGNNNVWCFGVEYSYIVLSLNQTDPKCGNVKKNYLSPFIFPWPKDEIGEVFFGNTF